MPFKQDWNILFFYIQSRYVLTKYALFTKLEKSIAAQTLKAYVSQPLDIHTYILIYLYGSFVSFFFFLFYSCLSVLAHLGYALTEIRYEIYCFPCKYPLIPALQHVTLASFDLYIYTPLRKFFTLWILCLFLNSFLVAFRSKLSYSVCLSALYLCIFLTFACR